MKHKWQLDKDGNFDTVAWDVDNNPEPGGHNGVRCLVCDAMPCVHCEPEWESLDDCKVPQKGGET